MTEIAEVVSGTEDANKARLRELASVHFDVYGEVYVREPMRGTTARIDFVLIPGERIPELPFDLIGVEVKRSPCIGSARRHALGQCINYRNCVLVDRRLPTARGLAMPVVALYYGGDSMRGYGPVVGRLPDSDGWVLYGEVRLAATQNVGTFVHHRHDGLTLEIAEEPIWCERRGVTGVGVNWPRARRFAHGNGRPV